MQNLFFNELTERIDLLGRFSPNLTDFLHKIKILQSFLSLRPVLRKMRLKIEIYIDTCVLII